MNIIGICRFSMVGRSDWRAFRGQPDENLPDLYRAQARILFQPARMEERLATFEHLTLASMRAQSDPDFRFLVIASALIPEQYRARLSALCAPVPQAVLRFFEPMHVVEAQRLMMEELNIAQQGSLQFRLDDDDAFAKQTIARARRHAAGLARNRAFAVGFSRHFFCVSGGEKSTTYSWFYPFLGTGSFVAHPTLSVFQFAHYRIPTRMVALTDPRLATIITHRGTNDTPARTTEQLKAARMSLAREREISAALAGPFSFLGPEGRALCGFPDPG